MDHTRINYTLLEDGGNNKSVIKQMKLHISYALLAVLAVDLLATSGDITMTWTSPVYPKLYSNDTSINPVGRPITPNEDAWIGSLINVGAIVGPLPFGFLAEKFGRKIGLLTIAVPHIIAYLSMAFGTSVNIYYFGRFLGGLAVGGGYTLLPMYIAEISKDSNRGFFSVTLSIFWSLGNFIPYAVGPYVSIMWYNIILAIFPILFFVAFLIIGTETPYYLVQKQQIEKAEKTLMKLRSLNKKEVQNELSQIKETLRKQESGSMKDIIMNAGLRKALILSLLLIMFQQLSGINAITFYLQPIFNSSGTKIPSNLASLAVGICIFLSSFIVPTIINKVRRRSLMMVSTIGMFLSLSMMGAFFYIKDSTDISTENIFWMPLLSLVCFIFTFTGGISILPWTVSSELFPSNVKQVSAMAVSSMCWLTSFIITKFFNDMVNGMGSAGTFWFYAGCCLLCAIVSFIYLPETKDKSFSEIQDMLQR